MVVIVHITEINYFWHKIWTYGENGRDKVFLILIIILIIILNNNYINYSYYFLRIRKNLSPCISSRNLPWNYHDVSRQWLPKKKWKECKK